MPFKIVFCLWLVLLSCRGFSDSDIALNQNPESISTSELQNYNSNSQSVKSIINDALGLACNNLKYQYGSADPKAGGMDCSGTIYYLLTKLGIKEVPRSSHLQYKWIWEQGHFYAVNGRTWNSFEFSHLKPGDMLFWSGTYQVKHDPDVTHVMIYIGKNKQGQPLMVGASNGRTYKGRKIYGVSVFDFQLPNAEGKSQFLGYSCIPQLTC